MERTKFIPKQFTPITNRKYYKYVKYPKPPMSSNDIYVTTTSGDRLDLLANQFYGNVDYWWIIATANIDIVRRDSYNLAAGLELRIPTDITSTLRNFEQDNKLAVTEAKSAIDEI